MSGSRFDGSRWLIEKMIALASSAVRWDPWALSRVKRKPRKMISSINGPSKRTRKTIPAAFSHWPCWASSRKKRTGSGG